jgi:acyl dehydratase
VSLLISRADLIRYAGASGDFNPIHWSDLAANQSGLPGVIAHGMLTMGRLIQLVVDWAGDPGRVIEYEVRFSRPVPVAEASATELTAQGEVRGIVDGIATVSLQLTCDGTKILGKAQAKVLVGPDCA